MQPGDRLVCAFVNKLSVGAEFKQWPLHVTVVPWFRTEVSTDVLSKEINKVLSDINPFEVRIDHEAVFGRDKTVNLIQQPTPFNDIEAAIRSLLKKRGVWLVDETTKKKRSYQPHVTAQKELRLHEGDGFWCDRLYVVEQKGEHKAIEAEVTV
jgi:2'-5' RNA ligase